MTLVESRDLRLGYDSRILAPCPDFTVDEGDFVAVVGPNGSGKTTLVKAIAALAAPVAGELHLAEGLRRGGIGYLPQIKSMQRDFPASVREVVFSGIGALGFRPFYTRGEKRMARAAMARFGVADLAKASFRELSGGQRQRVLLARALAVPRKLLLLDEPVTGLDPESAGALYRILGELKGEGLAVMMVTHDLSPVLPLATHILKLGRDASFERNLQCLAK